MPHPFRAVLATLLCLVGGVGQAKAETWAWACQGVLTTPEFRKTGNTDAARTSVELTVDTQPGGRITLRSPAVNLDLTTADPNDPDWADVYKAVPRPVVFAEGKGKIRMFDRAWVEACAARVTKARPSATSADQDLGGCYQNAPMTSEPVPVDVSFSAHQQGSERMLSVAFFHEGQDQDDPLMDIKQLNLNGRCTPK